MPSEVRPDRPARWFALAWETRSIGRRCTLVRFEYREMRAVPVSITYLMPGTVRDVSATFVASTIRRRTPAPARPNTRCCSAMDRRPNSGRISVPARRVVPATTPVRWSAASRISRSPGRNTRMSPGGSAASSRTASPIASRGSRVSAASSASSSGSSGEGSSVSGR